jgi:hypothetical protein
MKDPITTSIRSFLIFFLVILMLNLLVLTRNNFYELFFKSLGLSIMFGFTVLLNIISRKQWHLKFGAVAMILLTLILFTYFEYPIMEELLVRDNEAPMIAISIG